MKKTMFLCTVLFVMSMGLSGCLGNGFTKFYTGKSIEQATASGLQVCENPSLQAFPNEEPGTVALQMYENGYVLIGSSSWEGPAHEADAEALAQGKEVGACVVAWKADYSHTQQGSTPISTYTPGGTSTTIHSGSVYSGGSYGSYSGTSTTYNPGTVGTQYVEYSVARYDYRGLFFAKVTINPRSLMILGVDPSDEYMRATDSREGVLVIAVVRGGNAYLANIFRDDVIMSINGIPCDINSDNIDSLANGENIIKVWRDGKILEKVVNIPSKTGSDL